MIVCGAAAHASITFGTCWLTNETVGPQTTLTVSVSPVGGTGHVLLAYSRAGSGSSITFSDIHNTWNPAGAFYSFGGGNVSQTGLALNVTGGTYTLTATFSGSVGYASVGACEISGLLSSGVLDTAMESNTTSGTGLTVTSPSFNTAAASEIVVGIGSAGESNGTFVVGLIGANTPTLASPVANDMGLEYTTFSTVQTGITGTLNLSPSSYFGLTMVGLKASAAATSVGCDMSNTCN